MAVALIGLVISLVFGAQIDREDAEPLTKGLEGPLLDASVDGYRAGMLFAAALALAGALVGALAVSDREARGEEVTAPAAAPAGR
jgi:hypothetical protein